MNTTQQTPLVAKCVGPMAGTMLNIMGTRNEVKLHADECGGRLSVFEITAGPGDGIPPHIHTHEDEMFHVIEGEVEFNDNGTITSGGPGTFAFLPRGRMHAWFVRGDRPARMLLMTLPGTFNAFFAELATPVDQTRPMQEVIDICRRHGIEFI